jgi:hypothetical protein
MVDDFQIAPGRPVVDLSNGWKTRLIHWMWACGGTWNTIGGA